MKDQSQIENQIFNGIDYSEQPLSAKEYEDCRFVNCQLNNIDLSHIAFTSCEFVTCDISLSKLINTAFRTVTFQDCKLMGLHFEDTNEFLFEVTFQSCLLNLSSFYGRKIKKTTFAQCSLQEVDFGGTDLSESSFSDCDLSGAMFDNTNLEKCDLRTAVNFSIDPTKNRLKKARFSEGSLRGLLHGFDIIIS